MSESAEGKRGAPTDYFKSHTSKSEFDKLPTPTDDEVRQAVERGRVTRAKAEQSVQPGNVASSRVFYK